MHDPLQKFSVTQLLILAVVVSLGLIYLERYDVKPTHTHSIQRTH